MDFKDYYKILGVQPNATSENIRTAYRKLSKKFHPDVNSGDKFFEEKFKEIQEAYEILSDTLKRKQYDYIRANLNKSKNSYNQEHEDNLRKKEKELRKQKEEFKKWEDSLKKKEEILKEKQKEKRAPKSAYLILILLLGTILITLIYLTIDKNQNNTVNTTIASPTTDTALADALNYPSILDETTNILFSNSELVKTIDGIWTGSAYQYDVNESWTIKFTCNSKEGTFLIEYPSLGCSGNLIIENISNNEIEFRENILNGSGTCNNNGVIKLKMLNNRKFAYLYYLPNSSVINAKGQVIKSE